MTRPTPLRKNIQGSTNDLRFNKPEIVALLDEAEDLAEAHKEYLKKNKDARDMIKALNIEVPEGGEVRVAIVGEGAAYTTTIRHQQAADVEFTRQAGIRIGRVKRLE